MSDSFPLVSHLPLEALSVLHEILFSLRNPNFTLYFGLQKLSISGISLYLEQKTFPLLDSD